MRNFEEQGILENARIDIGYSYVSLGLYGTVLALRFRLFFSLFYLLICIPCPISHLLLPVMNSNVASAE